MTVYQFKAEQTLDLAHSTFSTRCEELSEVLQEREKKREDRPLKEHIIAPYSEVFISDF